MRICNKCKRNELETPFYDAAWAHKRNECKACYVLKKLEYQRTHVDECKARVKSWRIRNPERRLATIIAWQVAHPDLTADYRRRSKYGFVAGTYQQMVDERQGKCDICKQSRKLVVDHDHEKGKVRGLLCGKCNAMLGQAGDNEGVLTNAIEYLRRYNQNGMEKSPR